MHFGSFGIEYISEDIFNKIKDRSITQNIFRVQSEYMIAEEILLDYTNLFSSNEYQKKRKIRQNKTQTFTSD